MKYFMLKFAISGKAGMKWIYTMEERLFSLNQNALRFMLHYEIMRHYTKLRMYYVVNKTDRKVDYLGKNIYNYDAAFFRTKKIFG